jgi:hypothetical protein
MNEALEMYRDDKQVACIHGIKVTVDVPLPETFFLRGADIWGGGTWKRAWELYEYDAGRLLKEIESKRLSKTFDFDGAFGFTQMLRDQARGKLNTWDIQWYATTFLRNMLTLYPGRSLVQNIGFDNSGTHCGVSDRYSVTLSDGPIRVAKIPIQQDLRARASIRSFHKSNRVGLLRRILNKLSRSS